MFVLEFDAIESVLLEVGNVEKIACVVIYNIK